MKNHSRRETRLHYALALVAMFLSIVPASTSGLLLLERPSMRRGASVVPDLDETTPVRDATGTLVARRAYRRIVAMDGIDHVLSLVPADRIVGVGPWPVDHSLEGWRVAGRPRISEAREVEKIIACHPDLVVTCSAGNPEAREAIANLRQVGVAVFDLNYTIDRNDLLNQITSLGALLEVPERGLALREETAKRCALLRLPMRSPVPRAVFICSWGERVTVTGSDDIFDELLSGSGLRNAGAEAGLHLSPVVSVERALKMDLQVLLTRPMNRTALMQLPGINLLTRAGKVDFAYIPEPLIGSAVPLDLVETMESIQDHVYDAQPQRIQLSIHDR